MLMARVAFLAISCSRVEDMSTADVLLEELSLCSG